MDTGRATNLGQAMVVSASVLLAVAMAAEVRAASWVVRPALALPAAPCVALLLDGRARCSLLRLRGGGENNADDPAATREDSGGKAGDVGRGASGGEGTASPMQELQERVHGMRVDASANASTSPEGACVAREPVLGSRAIGGCAVAGSLPRDCV